MQNKKLNFILLFTALAIFSHFYLTLHFNGLKYGTLTDSLCNISSGFSCDTTSASPYAHIFDIPIAIFGLVVNLILFGWILFARTNWADDRDLLLRYSYYLSIPIALVSITMGGISLFILDSLCPFCMATYLFSFINLFLLWQILKSNTLPFVNDIKVLFKDQKSILVTLLLVPLFAYILNDMLAGDAKKIDKIAKTRVQDWSAETTYTFSADGLILGNPSTAKMHIVEFADFRCSHCKLAAPTLHTFTNLRDDVALTFKSFPLDGTCNKAITGGDGISCELAAITFCSENINQIGFKVHDYIFKNQTQIQTLNTLETIYTDLENLFKISAVELKKCATSQQMLDRIQKMAQEGELAKVEGTPTVYVNGKKLVNGHFMPMLEEVYSSIKK